MHPVDPHSLPAAKAAWRYPAIQDVREFGHCYPDNQRAPLCGLPAAPHDQAVAEDPHWWCLACNRLWAEMFPTDAAWQAVACEILNRGSRIDSYPPPKVATGCGVPISSFAWMLADLPGLDRWDPEHVVHEYRVGAFRSVGDADTRVMALPTARQYRRRAEDLWLEVPLAEMLTAFSFGEVFSLWWESSIQSRISEQIARDHRFLPMHRVKNSMWQSTSGSSFPMYLRTLRALLSFDFGLGAAFFDQPGYPYGMRGTGRYSRRFLDAPMAITLGIDGEQSEQPALVLGLIPSDYGLVISQVQGVGKGNRWMYRLGCSLLEWCVRRLHAADPELPLLVPTGQAKLAAVMESYGEAPEKLGAAHAAHIVKTYDQEIAGFRRGPVHKVSNLSAVHQLIPEK